AAVTDLAREEAVAVDALEAVDLDPETAEYLEELATFVAERER
ncbi:isopentenyl pyrophosphate isomerase, partial [Halobacteriales archaeon QH_10_67_13]